MFDVENANCFDEMLLKFWDRRGAKGCKSDRSRQEFSNGYLLAKISVDTAENEPLKVHLLVVLKSWDLIFTEPPAPCRVQTACNAHLPHLRVEDNI